MTPQAPTPLAERLQQLLKTKELNVSRFARTIGTKTPQAIREILKGNTKSLSYDIQTKMAQTMPDVNIAWLLTGNGEMLRDPNENEARFAMVPLVNIDSVGGMASTNQTVQTEQYVEKLLPFTDARPGDVCIHQSGDSMAPIIPAGSIMHIRRVEDWREYFGYGSTFVLWLKDDRRLTKQVKRYDPDPTNYVTCHSFNPAAGDEELPKSFIREVWKVIKVLTERGW